MATPTMATGYVDVSKLISLETWTKYRGFAYDNQASLDGFQNELKQKVDKTFDIEMKKIGVVYSE